MPSPLTPIFTGVHIVKSTIHSVATTAVHLLRTLVTNAKTELHILASTPSAQEKLKNEISLIASAYSAFQEVLEFHDKVVKFREENGTDAKLSTELVSEAVKLSSTLVTVGDSLANVSTSSGVPGLGLVSSGLSLAAAVIATTDGVDDEEKEEVVKSSIGLTAEIARTVCPTIGKPFGVVDLFEATAIGLYMGGVQAKQSVEKYSADGDLSLIDKRDIGIDTALAAMYNFTHQFTRDLDDAFFGFVEETTAKITGTTVNKYSKLNYAQKAAEGYKILFNAIGQRSADAAQRIADTFGVWADALTGKGSSLIGTENDDYIEGTKKNDSIVGDAGDDTLHGGKGKDKIDGGAGNDHIFGDDGNDTLSGSTGDDTLYGGKGKDRMYGDAGDDILYGNDGNDSMYGGSDDDILFGGKGNDKLFGSAGDDTLVGGAGNDQLTGGDGDDVFYYLAGNGNDVITDYVSDEDVIQIGSGTIQKVSVKKNDVVFQLNKGKLTVKNGKTKYITIVDADEDELIYLNGRQVDPDDDPDDGDDDSGDDGDDVLVVVIEEEVDRNAPMVVLGSDAVSPFRLTDYNSTATLAAVNIDARTVNNFSIYGDEKNNLIYSSSNGGTVTGGTGNDVIYLGEGLGHDRVLYSYSDGNDIIYNYADEDALCFSSYDVNLKNVSFSGNDVILNVGSTSYNTATNTITLKDAKDKAIYFGWGYNGVSKRTYGLVDISNGTAVLDANYIGTFTHWLYTDKFKDIDASNVVNSLEIDGDDQNNVIHGSKADSTIYANGGNDTIYGALGRGKIYGGAGNDIIYGAQNGGEIKGDDGDDEIHVANSSMIVSNTVTGGTGNDVIYLGEGLGHDRVLYSYGDGNDIIYNYADEDALCFSSYDVNLKNVSFSGNDVILNVGSTSYNTATNTITLKDAKDKAIYFGWGYNGVSKRTYGLVDISNGTAVLDANYLGTFMHWLYADKFKDIDASNVVNSLQIDGDDQNNVIHGSKADSTIYANGGDDTIYGADNGGQIYGGTGNDVIHLGEGLGQNIVNYYYGDGNDTVYNFIEADRVYLGSSEAKLDNISYNNSDVILNLTSGNTITLKNAKGTTVNITGQSYGSYSTSEEAQLPTDDYWFMQSDQSSEESPLNEIMQPEAAVELELSTINDPFNPTLDRIVSSARHRQRK